MENDLPVFTLVQAAVGNVEPGDTLTTQEIHEWTEVHEALIWKFWREMTGCVKKS